MVNKVYSSICSAVEESQEKVDTNQITQAVVQRICNGEPIVTSEEIEYQVTQVLESFGYRNTAGKYQAFMDMRRSVSSGASPKEGTKTLMQYLWEKISPDPAHKIISICLRIPARRFLSFTNSTQFALQRVLFFCHNNNFVYGLISEEYPDYKWAYLAFVEKNRTYLEKNGWKMRDIVKGYANFLAIVYSDQTQQQVGVPSLISSQVKLYIWPDPPKESDEGSFFFTDPDWEETIRDFDTHSLRYYYKEALGGDHSQIYDTVQLGALTLPVFGLRGSRDPSFKTTEEMLALQGQFEQKVKEADYLCQRLNEELASNTMVFRLFPPPGQPLFRDFTRWEAGEPFNRTWFKKILGLGFTEANSRLAKHYPKSYSTFAAPPPPPPPPQAAQPAAAPATAQPVAKL